jgi:hypothetical protein
MDKFGIFYDLKRVESFGHHDDRVDVTS